VITIGEILRPHGTKGEVKIMPMTDFPERFALVETVYLGEELRPVAIEGQRSNRDRIILKLSGCDHRDEARKLQGQFIHVPIEEAMPLEEGEYYLYEILGMEVWTTEGEFLGCVDDVLFTGSNDVYVVKRGDQELLIPAVSHVVSDIDTQRGRLTVQLMEGLR